MTITIILAVPFQSGSGVAVRMVSFIDTDTLVVSLVAEKLMLRFIYELALTPTDNELSSIISWSAMISNTGANVMVSQPTPSAPILTPFSPVPTQGEFSANV